MSHSGGAGRQTRPHRLKADARTIASRGHGPSGVGRQLYNIGMTTNHREELGTMSEKRKVEVFSAGCPACEEAIALVQNLACAACDVQVLDMKDPAVASRAKSLG